MSFQYTESSDTQNSSPDIILIVSDDVNYNLLRASRCPHIKSLMRGGTNFTKIFNYGGSSGAVCKSSRLMMLYGVPWDHSGSRGKPFPAILRRNGYSTFATGKWHSSRDLFDSCFDSYKSVFFGGQVSQKSKIVSPKKQIKLGKQLPGGIFTQSLISYIQNYDSGFPYFAYIGFTEPHDPLRLVNGGNGNQPVLPNNFKKSHPFNFGQNSHRDEKMLKKPLQKKDVLANIHKYQSQMTYLDNNVGKIIKNLKRPTVVIFTTDNGICKGNHGLMGKQNLYQESIHLPFSIWSNKQGFSGQCAKLGYLTDVYATILNIAGISDAKYQKSTSKNLIAMMKGQPGRKYLTFRFKNEITAVLSNGWKLIYYRKQNRYQLYNLMQDPNEKNPVDPKKVPEIYAKMKGILFNDN